MSDTDDPEDTEEARAARAAALRTAMQGLASPGPRSPRDLTNEEAHRAAEDARRAEEDDPGGQ